MPFQPMIDVFQKQKTRLTNAQAELAQLHSVSFVEFPLKVKSKMMLSISMIGWNYRKYLILFLIKKKDFDHLHFQMKATVRL